MSLSREDFLGMADRARRTSLIAGVVGLGLCVIGAFFDPQEFFRSYLVAFLLWSGVMLGAMVVVMLHHLAGGGWGYLMRRPLECAMSTWPMIALAVLPILFGMPLLFGWTHASAGEASEIVRAKMPYLNVPFFVLRNILYFAVWIFLAWRLNTWSSRQDESDDPEILRKLQNISGPGMVAYWVTMSFASVDWIMSLEVDWFSTVFSAIIIVGQALSAVAVVIILSRYLFRLAPLEQLASPKYINDVGNILLMLVMLWAYMNFGQLLIIWSGNLSDEIGFFRHRITGSWEVVSLLLFMFHFALPFALLLHRPIKRNLKWLSSVALLVLFFRLVEMVWLVEPSFDRLGMKFHWMDWVLPIGMGGIWFAYYLGFLRERALLPYQDPRLPLVRERMRHARVGDVSNG